MWPKIAENYVLPSSSKMALLFSDHNSMTFHQDSIWLGKLLKLIMEIGTFQRSCGPGASKAEWKEAPRGERVKSTPQLSCCKGAKSQQSVRSVNLSHPQYTHTWGPFELSFLFTVDKKIHYLDCCEKYYKIQRSTFHRVHYTTVVS